MAKNLIQDVLSVPESYDAASSQDRTELNPEFHASKTNSVWTNWKKKVFKLFSSKKSQQQKSEIWIEPSQALQSATYRINRIEQGRGNAQDRHFIMDRPDGTGLLRIGFLKGNQRDFIKEIIPLIQTGEISKIDAGQIVGPKALHFLIKLVSYAPPSAPIRVIGFMNLNLLLKTFEAESQSTNPEGPYYIWRPRDIDNLRDALETLKIKESSINFFGSNSENWDWMEFSFDSNTIQQIKWNPI